MLCLLSLSVTIEFEKLFEFITSDNVVSQIGTCCTDFRNIFSLLLTLLLVLNIFILFYFFLYFIIFIAI